MLSSSAFSEEIVESGGRPLGTSENAPNAADSGDSSGQSPAMKRLQEIRSHLRGDNDAESCSGDEAEQERDEALQDELSAAPYECYHELLIKRIKDVAKEVPQLDEHNIVLWVTYWILNLSHMSEIMKSTKPHGSCITNSQRLWLLRGICESGCDTKYDSYKSGATNLLVKLFSKVDVSVYTPKDFVADFEDKVYQVVWQRFYSAAPLLEGMFAFNRIKKLPCTSDADKYFVFKKFVMSKLQISEEGLWWAERYYNAGRDVWMQCQWYFSPLNSDGKATIGDLRSHRMFEQRHGIKSEIRLSLEEQRERQRERREQSERGPKRRRRNRRRRGA